MQKRRRRQVTEAWKKRREEAHLLRFRKNVAGFPRGEVITHEHPDFLVKTHHGRIGIELTEYVREPDEVGGSAMRAQERTEDRVLLTASRQHQSKGMPPVMVQVFWDLHTGPARSKVRELADALVDLVERNLPEAAHRVIIGYPHPEWRFLPQEVVTLFIDRRLDLSSNQWTSVRWGLLPTLIPAKLQKIMRKKEAKVPSYRQECQEVWLLIVAHGFEPSTHCKLGPEVEDHEFETGFDRVFFLHHANEYVTELRVRPSGPEAGRLAPQRLSSSAPRRRLPRARGSRWRTVLSRITLERWARHPLGGIIRGIKRPVRESGREGGDQCLQRRTRR
jgi:hypothetical protein